MKNYSMKFIILSGVVMISTFLSGGLRAAVRLSDSSVRDEPVLASYLHRYQVAPSVSVQELLSGQDVEVRRSLYRAIWVTIRDSSDLTLRQELTGLFTFGLNDKMVGNFVVSRLWLPPFEADFFSQQAIDNILHRPHGVGSNAEYVRIIGVAGIPPDKIDVGALGSSYQDGSRISVLYEAIGVAPTVYRSSTDWAALLVKARRGDRSALSEILAYIDKLSESWVYSNPEFMDDLGFVRQPEAVDILVGYLRKEPASIPAQSDSDTGFVPVAERAARALSLALADYPFDYWDVVTDERLEAARRYVASYAGRDWKILGKASQVTPSAGAPDDAHAVVKHSDRDDNPPQRPRPKSSWWLASLLVLAVILFFLVPYLRRR